MHDFPRICFSAAVIALLLSATISAALGAEPHGALQFDGVDDYVDIGPDPAFELTSYFTIEAWVRIDVEDQISHKILCNRSLTAGQEGFGFSVFWLRPVFTMFAHTDIGLWDDASIPVGEWTHIAAVFDATARATLYVDGVQTHDTGGPVPSNPNSGPLLIGKCPEADVDTWLGGLDDIRIWNTAIDVATLRDWRYRKLDESHPNAPDLLAHWDLDEESGQEASDASGNGFDGRLGDSFDSDAADPSWIVGAVVFGDDFEMGDTAAWTSSTP